MASTTPSSAQGGSPRPVALVERLEEILRTLAQISHGGRNTSRGAAVAACPDALNHICSALRDMAGALEAGRADLLAQRQADLAGLMAALSENMRTLREANQRATTQIAERDTEFAEASTHAPGPQLAGTLRDIAAAMHHAADELGARLESVVTQTEEAAKRAAALEAQVIPAAKPAPRNGHPALHSRQEFDARLDFALATGPFSGPWSLLLAELDELDELTERYGVSPCDMLLDRIAYVVALRVRQHCPDAFPAEYRDGAFAAIVPGDPEFAATLADEVRRAIAAVNWAVSTKKGKTDLASTASIGIAPYRIGDTPATLVRRTQQALDQARRQGPDKVVSAE